MFIKSIISGSVITVVLISVLAATRLMNTLSEPEELEIFELEEVLMEAPPEPLLEEEVEEPEETLPQPPIPSLELIQDTVLDVMALPLTQATFNPELEVDPFQVDRAPADLPVVKAPPKPKYKPKAAKRSKSKPKYTPKKTTIKPKVKPKYTPKPPRREVVKSYYSTGELDGAPRAIRQGRFTWPRKAKGSSGTVRMILEINTSGRVKVISVTSSSDPNLISPAKRVAVGSRYTPPMYRGKAVKARFTKTYHLKKP